MISRSRRVSQLSLLIGGLVLGGSVLSYWQLARMTPEYAELVAELERAERVPGQPNAALDHARPALEHLRERDARRWKLGGYAFSHTFAVILGVALLGFGFRSLSGRGEGAA